MYCTNSYGVSAVRRGTLRQGLLSDHAVINTTTAPRIIHVCHVLAEALRTPSQLDGNFQSIHHGRALEHVPSQSRTYLACFSRRYPCGVYRRPRHYVHSNNYSTSIRSRRMRAAGGFAIMVFYILVARTTSRGETNLRGKLQEQQLPLRSTVPTIRAASEETDEVMF